jgi:hypothetical protein
VKEPLRTLLLMGVRHAGSYDPDDVLPYFEESLTFSECETTRDFLSWCHTNNKKFGHGTIDDRWAEFMGEVVYAGNT